MTIASPNRDRQFACAMRWLVVGIAGMLLAIIFLYNGMVAVRSQATQKTKLVDALKVENAQLKNDFYTYLDTRTLISAAERLGYVKDANPAYLSFNANGTALGESPSVSYQSPH